MYKQTVITIVLSVALVISALANVSYSRSQNALTATRRVNAASIAEPSRESQSRNGFLHPDGSGRYWLWLLPIVSLPFLVIALKKRGSEDLENELWPYNQYSVGTKGGISYGSTGHDNEED